METEQEKREDDIGREIKRGIKHININAASQNNPYL